MEGCCQTEVLGKAVPLRGLASTDIPEVQVDRTVSFLPHARTNLVDGLGVEGYCQAPGFPPVEAWRVLDALC